jgi:uncharacterized phage protein (TIGR01671 family)
MRDIKFRAWDKDENRMHQDVDVLRNGQIIYFEVDEYGEPTHWHNNYDYNFEKKFADTYIVMQYTGLKDKNGKEIYEGDIVKSPCDIEGSIHGEFSFQEVVYRIGTWIVQYLKSETGFKLPRGYTAGLLIDSYDHDTKSLVFYDGRLGSDNSMIEVIGNIYENPELLGN